MASTHPQPAVSTPQVALEAAPLSLPPPAVPEPVNYLVEAVLEPVSCLEVAVKERVNYLVEAVKERVNYLVEAVPEPVSCLEEAVKERVNCLQEVTVSSLREKVHPLPFLAPVVCMEQVAVKDRTSHPLLAEVPYIQ